MNTKMWKQFLLESEQQLDEMPITSLKKVGDFNKSSGFDAQDRKLLNNEKAVRKIQNLWSKTRADFDIYLVNSPKLNKPQFREVGKVEPKLFQDLGLPEIQQGEDTITIVFNGNFGAEKTPLTAWTMAHRVGHVLNRDRKNSQWEDFYKAISEAFKTILKDLYKTDIPEQYRSGIFTFGGNKLIQLCQIVGTFKSARDKNIRTAYEFIYELFAQYLITGQVKFNPLPTHFSYYDNKSKRTVQANLDIIDELNDYLDMFGHDCEYYIENILSGAINNIYLM